jgi:hypothetical protein
MSLNQIRVSSPTRCLRSRGGVPLLAVPALLLVFALVGCSFDGTAKKVIVGANEVQDGAKNAFNDAKAQTEAAGKACGTAARAAIPPVTPSLEACAALGVPIPYDPEKLNKLEGPINATYEAIRAAESVRLAWKKGEAGKADVIAQITLGLDAISRLVNAANDLGIDIDRTPLDEVIRKWESVK